MQKTTDILLAVFLALLAIAAVMAPIEAKPSMAEARKACMEDYRKFCSDVRPGGGRIKQCLIAHRSEISPACRAVLEEKSPQ